MTESKLSKTIVLHSCRTWLPQTQIWLYNQVCYLPNNIENHIFCEKTENLEQFYLPNIHSLKNASKLQFYFDKTLRKLRLRHHLEFYVEVAKREKATLLHSHFGHIGWANLNVAQKAGLKHVVTFYGLDVNGFPKQDPVWNRRYQKLFEAVDLILCEGSHMAKCIVNLGCPKNKVQVHHLGVNVNEIKFKPRVWIPQTTLKVIICATFREKKGIPYALEALGQLQPKISLEITIIGDANSKNLEEQKEKQKILAAIDKYGLKSKVRLLGYQPHDVLLKEAYQHHIFISPSITASDGDTEGGAPVSIIDMAATGMPIISTTHCDIPEVIINGVTGLLVEERDVVGLKKSLNYLIDNPKLWHEMTSLGRQHIEKEYDARIQGLRLAEIYKLI